MAALLVALTTLRLWPFLQGRVPASGDHTVHLHKLWFLWERLLPRARLSGWSSYWFLGEPVGDLYPPGQDLWAAAVRAMTLGQLSWERSYGLAFASFYLFSAWCLYDLGRRRLSPLAGAVAATLWILDPGAWEQGGWLYQVYYGVWGQGLAQALLLPALHRTLLWVEVGRRKDLGLASLLCGLALFCHPMSLILLGFGGLALVLGCGLRGREALLRLVAPPGLGTLVSSTFLLTFLGRSGYTRNIGLEGVSGVEVLGQLLQGQLMESVPPGVGALGLLGAGLLLWRRDRLGRALVGLFVFLWVARTTLVSDLPWKELPGPDLSNIQFRRLSIPARTLLLLLAGVGAAQAISWIRAWGQARRPALLGALLLALLGHGLVVWGQKAVEDGRELPMLDEPRFAQSASAWLAWSREQWSHREAFYRIATILHPHDHHLMSSTLTNRTPTLKIGYTPAHMFRWAPDQATDALFRVASVRWILSGQPVDARNVRLEQDWGPLRLYEYLDYRPERYTLDGDGLVEPLSFEDERAAFRLRGVEPGARFILHVSEYPRWEARINGEVVPIEGAPLWEGGDRFLISVPARDGILTFDYVRRPLDWLAMTLSLVGVGVSLAQIRRSPS